VQGQELAEVKRACAPGPPNQRVERTAFRRRSPARSTTLDTKNAALEEEDEDTDA
jgi:hypothetical protein